MPKKILKKGFCFLGNCIWTGWVKMSLSRGEYLISSVNVLKNGSQILRITKRDFLRLSSLGSDQ